jgi:hypothetical protein
MIARAAQNNVSIFRKEESLPLNEVVVKYIKKVSITIYIRKLFKYLFLFIL